MALRDAAIWPRILRCNLRDLLEFGEGGFHISYGSFFKGCFARENDRVFALAYRQHFILFAALSLFSGTDSPAQQQPTIQEKLQQMQQAAVRNTQQLHIYQWIESTSLAINGKTGELKESICHYAPDGQLVTTPLGEQGTPKIGGGPLKQHIVKKKIEEAEEEISEISNLVSTYLPLNPSQFEAARHTKRVNFEHEGESGNTIIINDYVKLGDQFRLSMNMATLQIQKIVIQTYFKTPQDPMSVDVRFSQLADGTVYPSISTINAPSKKVVIRKTSANFSKPAY